MNRLITANSGTSLWGSGGFTYDSMGNMTSLQLGSRSQTFAYVGTTPRLQSVTGSEPESVEYDAAGNEGKPETITLYGPRNLLQVVADPMPQGQSIAYVYDGRGVRVAETWNRRGGGGIHNTWPQRRFTMYSPELHPLAKSEWAAFELEGSFTGTDYIWFAGMPVAEGATDPSVPMRFTFTDHLGTPILQTDADGAIVWRAEYEPFGRVYEYRAGDVYDPQVLRLPGQEVDEFSSVHGGERSYNIWFS